MMNLAFAGFRHSHILSLYDAAIKDDNVNIVGCYEENPEKSIITDAVSLTYASYEEVLSDARVDAIAIGDYYAKRGQMV
ncbi:MAG: hypothetical protein IJD83_09995, partial [Clostridia bacterium]|nr:hypothetical protein [Clostridia bacterium]